MLNDNSIQELHDCLTPEDVFPQTNNRGGVCYFITDKEKTDSLVRVVTHANQQVVADLERELLINGIDIFVRDGLALSIIQQIINVELHQALAKDSDLDYQAKIDNLSSLVSALRPFGLRSYVINSDLYTLDSSTLQDPIKCIGKGRLEGYVERDSIPTRQEWIDRWKVLVPRANNIGTELNDDNLNSFVVGPNAICTESYLVIGADLHLTEVEAQALAKYLQTKFVRFLHKQAKVSQDATSKTYRFVPLQDFSSQSDLDWNCTVEQLDQQLFAKYQLTAEQAQYIQANIKDMQ